MKTLSLGRRMRNYGLALLLFLVFHMLRWTWRLEEDPLPADIQERLERGLPVVFAHWHEDEWAMLGFYARRNMIVLVSLSDDGSLMTNFLKLLGYRVARGSSSRGAATGLRGLLRLVNQAPQKTLSLAVDGPRGPRRHAKKGVFKVAQDLAAPLVAGAAAADRAWVFRKSWSKAFVPKPFARVRLSYVAPVRVSSDVAPEGFRELGQELDEKMLGAKSLAEKQVTQPT